MAKKKISEIIEEEAGAFLAENGYELYNVEFVKEGRDWFLRIYVDFAESGYGEERYISTDDCEKVSRHLSDLLDALDPIEQNYYLEVSSPGLDRTLLREKDYHRYVGKQVEIRLYQAVNGKKSWEGTLKGLCEGTVTIVDDRGAEVHFPLEQITKTKLKVIF